MHTTTLQQEKIGPTIARGCDSIVKKYGKDHVIKYSTFSRWLGKKYKAKMLRDYAISKRYLGDFLVDVEIIDDPKRHIEIQPYIQGEKLSPEHLQHPLIQQQFSTLKEAVDRMQCDNIAPVDLISSE